MPFSWNNNKTRRNRFSKLIADHLKSPKTRPSLVLETGFPRSVIDLYVRNRARFRKVSVKKPNKSSSGSVVESSNSSSGGLDIREYYDEIIEDEIEIVNSRKIEAKLNYVTVVMLNIMLVAVLIFHSKRFNIGITVSAFVLLLLESFGKRLKSVNLDSVVVCSQVFETEDQVELKKEESDGVLIEIVHKSSRKDMMKSRIKKLVPKKLRRSSMDSKHEICYGFKQEEAAVKPIVSLDSKSEIFCVLKQDLDNVECDDDDELGANLRRNYGCLVLFLIVLVGLIGGRFLALGMAFSWCLMLKLQSRNVKICIS
ncbi:uncharacterized protein LOC143556122 [Bidens hawaiensis]|uniref:uncharacterized protein LOC143556122 n=1 Tax=Bidens hawaiensis TaxID=980011 RepID=UPI0040497210